MRRRHKTKKLKTPLWQQIVYLLFVAGGPALTIYFGSITSPKASPWYISYMTIFFLGLIGFILVNSFLIKPWKIKMQAQMATLELNYQTKVGHPLETHKMWKNISFKMFLWDGGFLLFVALGIYILFAGAIAWLDKIQFYILIMFASVFFGLIFKAFCYIGNPFKHLPSDEDEE